MCIIYNIILWIKDFTACSTSCDWKLHDSWEVAYTCTVSNNAQFYPLILQHKILYYIRTYYNIRIYICSFHSLTLLIVNWVYLWKYATFIEVSKYNQLPWLLLEGLFCKLVCTVYVSYMIYEKYIFQFSLLHYHKHCKTYIIFFQIIAHHSTCKFICII